MKIVFDQGVPVPLRSRLVGHDIVTVYELGWSTRRNGEILRGAEELGYDVFVTTDQNLRYQQHLPGRRISIVVLQSTSWPRIQNVIAVIVAAIEGGTTGSYQEVAVP